MTWTPAERVLISSRRKAAAAEKDRSVKLAAVPPVAEVDGCEVCGTERPACGAVEGCNRCGREFCAGCRGGDALCRECLSSPAAAIETATGLSAHAPAGVDRPAGATGAVGSTPTGRIPRKPKAPRRPQPPRALNEAEGKLWKRLTREQDCSEWRQARLDALANYCRHMAMVELLSTRADGHSDDDMPGLGKLLAMRDREIRAAHAAAKAWGES